MAQQTQIIIIENDKATNRSLLQHNQKVVVTAADNVRIVLLEPESDLPARDLQARKVGNNLIVADSTGEEFLMIKDYYILNDVVVGTIVDNHFMPFADNVVETTAAPDVATQNTYTPLVIDTLNEMAISDIFSGVKDNWVWGGLALTALGVAMAANDDDDARDSVVLPAPEALNLTAALSANNQKVTGSTQAGALVTAMLDEAVIATTTATSEGNYVLDLPTAYANGEVINVVATSAAGEVAVEQTLIVPDTTAPTLTSYTLNDDNQVITGKTEANAVVTAKLEGEVIATTTANENGNYTLDLLTSYTNGETILLSANDAANNVSTTQSIAVSDTTPPETLTAEFLEGLNNQIVNGNTEPNAIVTAFYNDTVIAEVQAIEFTGYYSIDLDRPYALGDLITIRSTDSVGNSKTIEVPVTVEAPIVDDGIVELTYQLAEDNVTIIGQTDPESIVTVKYNDAIIGESTANPEGSFQINLEDSYTNGEILTIRAVDTATNESEIFDIYAPITNLEITTDTVTLQRQFVTDYTPVETTILTETDIDNLSLGVDFEITGLYGIPKLTLTNDSGILEGSYSYVLIGPDDVIDGNIDFNNSEASITVELTDDALFPGMYQLRVDVISPDTKVELDIIETTGVDNIIFDAYRASGHIFSDMDTLPENYALVINGESLVVRSAEAQPEPILIDTQKGKVVIYGNGHYDYYSDTGILTSDIEKLSETINVEVRGLQGDLVADLTTNITLNEANASIEPTYNASTDNLIENANLSTEGDDLLFVYADNDSLNSIDGSDTYIIFASDLLTDTPITIFDFDLSNSLDVDTLHLKGINESDVTLSQTGTDALDLKLTTEAGSIIIEGQFYDGVTSVGIDEIHFDNGQTLTLADIETMVLPVL